MVVNDYLLLIGILCVYIHNGERYGERERERERERKGEREKRREGEREKAFLLASRRG